MISLHLIENKSAIIINSIMFSIKSSKELAQQLEEQLVKGKDHLPLNGEDP